MLPDSVVMFQHLTSLLSTKHPEMDIPRPLNGGTQMDDLQPPLLTGMFLTNTFSLAQDHSQWRRIFYRLADVPDDQPTVLNQWMNYRNISNGLLRNIWRVFKAACSQLDHSPCDWVQGSALADDWSLSGVDVPCAPAISSFPSRRQPIWSVALDWDSILAAVNTYKYSIVTMKTTTDFWTFLHGNLGMQTPETNEPHYWHCPRPGTPWVGLTLPYFQGEWAAF